MNRLSLLLILTLAACDCGEKKPSSYRSCDFTIERIGDGKTNNLLAKGGQIVSTFEVVNLNTHDYTLEGATYLFEGAAAPHTGHYLMNANGKDCCILGNIISRQPPYQISHETGLEEKIEADQKVIFRLTMDTDRMPPGSDLTVILKNLRFKNLVTDEICTPRPKTPLVWKWVLG